jgi:hypothetical protein
VPGARRVCGLALASGCSFIGARVPDHPPAPTHCPSGVIVADVVGAGLTLVPGLAGGAALAFGDTDPGGPLLLVVVPPLLLLGGVYVASAIYGNRASNRCSRMQEQAQQQYEAEGRQPTREPVRNTVMGDRPLHCTTAELGECFFDEAACARSGGPCEIKTAGWCFDVANAADNKTTCTATRTACEVLRGELTSDRTLTVSTCGAYAVRQAR